MPSAFYRELLIAEVNRAIALATAAGAVGHKGLQGDFREQAVKGILDKVLPSSVLLGAGKVVDPTGRESQECDIIIYSPQLMSAATLSAGAAKGVFPVDATLFALEVKTTLDSKEVKDSIEKANTLRSLQCSKGRPFFALFAFGSDLTPSGKTELDRLAECDSNIFLDPPIHLFCVVGRSFGIFLKRHALANPSQSHWRVSPASPEREEVLDFLCMTANSINANIEERGTPPLGPYVINEREYTEHFANGKIITQTPAG